MDSETHTTVGGATRLPGSPLAWLLGLLLMPSLALMAYFLGARSSFMQDGYSYAAACGLGAIGAPVAGLLASSWRRPWVAGETSSVILFKTEKTSAWLCLRCMAWAVALPLLMPLSLRLYFAPGALLGPAIGLVIALRLALAVVRTLLDVCVVTLYPDRVTVWGFGVPLRACSAKAVGERELAVSFTSGREASLWLPKLLGPPEGRSRGQLVAVELAVELVLGRSRENS